MLDNNEALSKQYARACEERADKEFEDILSIADNSGNDKVTNDNGDEVVDNEAIARDRLRVDARKWRLSKMLPKKYGDKIDVTTDGEKVNNANPVNLSIDGKKIELK
jgi:hypothetical protein